MGNFKSTTEILNLVFSGETLNTVQSTAECFNAVYSTDDNALKVNVIGGGGGSGTDGTSGIDGVNGTDGTSGIDGINGTDGVNGTDGTSGIDGVADITNIKNRSILYNNNNVLSGITEFYLDSDGSSNNQVILGYNNQHKVQGTSHQTSIVIGQTNTLNGAGVGGYQQGSIIGGNNIINSNTCTAIGQYNTVGYYSNIAVTAGASTGSVVLGYQNYLQTSYTTGHLLLGTFLKSPNNSAKDCQYTTIIGNYNEERYLKYSTYIGAGTESTRRNHLVCDGFNDVMEIGSPSGTTKIFQQGVLYEKNIKLYTDVAITGSTTDYILLISGSTNYYLPEATGSGRNIIFINIGGTECELSSIVSDTIDLQSSIVVGSGSTSNKKIIDGYSNMWFSI